MRPPFDLVVLVLASGLTLLMFARRMGGWPGAGALPLGWRVILLASVLLFASGVGIALAMVLTLTAVTPGPVPVALIVAGVAGVLGVQWRWRRA